MGQDCDLIWKDEKLHNQHKEKNMGRTIKISELKKFDVFSFRGGQFMWPDNIDEIIIVCPSLDENESLRVGCETEIEVELLGKMVFETKE